MSDNPKSNAPQAPTETTPVTGVAANKPRSIGPRFWSKVRANKWLMAGTIIATLLILFVIFLGGIAVFDWTESTAFCSLCHVMKPEYTAYKSSPHSRVDCGTCHIGPGPTAAVKAKLSNVKYLWEAPTGWYEKPIPSPITDMRPVEVVCEQCHWPEKFYDDRMSTISDYAEDESNSLTQIKLLLKTGGGLQNAGQGRGIHWHIANPVYYIATDKQRQEIDWVQATFNGKTTEYVATDSKLTPEQIAKADKRKMDCIDCHNRATHIFQRPSEALDAALAAGSIPSNLPFIKREGTNVLEKTYATEDAAAKAIAAVEDFYRTQYPEVYNNRKADVQKAVAGLQTIFDNTQFPFMRVTWEAHPTNIGHMDFAGCFRCHDGKHMSQDGQAIRLECNICHSIPQVIVPGKTTASLPLTTGIEPDSHKSTTWLSEHRTRFDDTCANCHTTGNAGGSDNSSFCSNSACHGTNWKFAGLDAPGVQKPAQPVPATPAATPTSGSGAAETATPAAPAGGGAPPAIPHDLAGRDNCLTCHNPEGGVKPAPKDHVGRTNDMCQTCHKPSTPGSTAAPTEAPTQAAATATPAAPAGGGGPPAIPHDLAGRDNCLMCHNPDGGVKPAPKDHAGRTNDMCQTCHKPSTSANPTTAPAATPTTAVTATPAAPSGGASPPAIPHDLAGRDNCLMCHNPEGGVKPAPKDHAGRTNDMCQTCHKPK
jgi:nitrate/TMAO reductase-like tetraheme cytochrome c subunit